MLNCHWLEDWTSVNKLLWVHLVLADWPWWRLLLYWVLQQWLSCKSRTTLTLSLTQIIIKIVHKYIFCYLTFNILYLVWSDLSYSFFEIDCWCLPSWVNHCSRLDCHCQSFFSDFSFSFFSIFIYIFSAHFTSETASCELDLFQPPTYVDYIDIVFQ